MFAMRIGFDNVRGVTKNLGRIGVVLLLLGLLVKPAIAADSVANGFRITPVKSESIIEKGSKQKITLSVENPTNIATIARVTVRDFIASDDESGSPKLILDSNSPPPRNSFRSLVGDIADIPLGPHEKKNVEVTVSVPLTANSGGYYGAILFSPIDDSQQSNVGLKASLGPIVLVTVPGDLKEQLRLVQLSVI